MCFVSGTTSSLVFAAASIVSSGAMLRAIVGWVARKRNPSSSLLSNALSRRVGYTLPRPASSYPSREIAQHARRNGELGHRQTRRRDFVDGAAGAFDARALAL